MRNQETEDERKILEFVRKALEGEEEEMEDIARSIIRLLGGSR